MTKKKRSNTDSDDEQELEKFNDVDSLPDVADGPWINSMDKFMESTFESEYE